MDLTKRVNLKVFAASYIRIRFCQNTFEVDSLNYPLVGYELLKYNAKFLRAPIGRNQSHVTRVSLLSGHLLAYSARF